MRVAAAVFVALMLPLPLLAQYPAPGRYAAGASQAGSDGSFPQVAVVEKSGDSTTVRIASPGDKGDTFLPMLDQRAFKSGFQLTLGVVDGGLTCRFAPPNSNGRWEAMCENPDHTMLFTFFIDKKEP